MRKFKSRLMVGLIFKRKFDFYEISKYGVIK